MPVASSDNRVPTVRRVSTTSTRIKEYFEEERTSRTETSINDTRDFGLGRRLCSLPALRAIGFGANRRALEVDHVSEDF